MPTRRMIEPSFWQSESMGRLTIRQRLMFIGMFSNADDQGRIRASAAIVRSIVLPFDDVTIADVEADILAIEREKCVKLYTVNDARYAQILNWWTYQTPQWAYPSLIPKMNGWADRLRFRQSNEVITDNWHRGKIEEDSIDQDSIVKGKAKRKALGKDLGKDDGATTPRKPSDDTCPKEWMTALYSLAKIDAGTATIQARKNLSDCGKALVKSGATLEQVSTFERNWYAQDWRGKQGQAPTVKQVRDEWGKYSQPMNGNGNGNGHTPQIDPARQAALAKAFR